MSFYCSRCGQYDSTNTIRTHVCSPHRASNSSTHASNEHLTHASNTNGSSPAGHTGLGGLREGDELGGPEISDSGRDLGKVSRKTKQRWSRDKYNAYQREYMRKRRACECCA